MRTKLRIRVAGPIAALALLAAPTWAQQSERRIAIMMPANDETVHSNSGDVNVVIAVTPPLALNQTVVLTLDDQEVARGPGTRVQLSGVERGTHRLQARLLDARGNTLAESGAVTFHMWQASRLYPNRKKQ